MAAEPIELAMMRRRVMLKESQDSERVIPFSCSTNLSNDVTEHLSRVKLGGAAASFCLKMHRDSFGQAGNQRDRGLPDPGLWCDFNLAVWSRTLSIEKSNIRRIRSDLEACHIISFVPDEDNPGSGRLKWNLDFSQWAQYNKRPGRTASNDVIRAQKQTSVVILTENDDKQSDVVILTENPVKITTDEQVKITTVASRDDSDGQASQEPLRKVTERKKENRTRDTNVSQGAAAPLSDTASKTDGVKFTDDEQRRFNLAMYFRDKVHALDPDLPVPAATPKGLAQWCEKARLLLANYDSQKIGRAINFAFSDSWWVGKVTTMAEFHSKFRKICAQMSAAEERGKTHGKQDRAPATTHHESDRSDIF